MGEGLNEQRGVFIQNSGPWNGMEINCYQPSSMKIFSYVAIVFSL